MPNRESQSKPASDDRQEHNHSQSSVDSSSEMIAYSSNSQAASVLRRAKINPTTLTPQDVIRLQRHIGNHAVTKLLAQQKGGKQSSKPQLDNVSAVANTVQAKRETIGGPTVGRAKPMLQAKGSPMANAPTTNILGAQRKPSSLNVMVIQRVTDVYNKDAFADPVTYIKGKKSGSAIVEDSGSMGVMSPPLKNMATALATEDGREAFVTKLDEIYGLIGEGKAGGKTALDYAPISKALKDVSDAASAVAFVRANSLLLDKLGLLTPVTRLEGNTDDTQTFHYDSGFVKLEKLVPEKGKQKGQMTTALNGPFKKGWVQGHHAIDNYRHRFIEHVHVNKGKSEDKKTDIYNGTEADAKKAEGWKTTKEGGPILKATDKDNSLMDEAYELRKDLDAKALAGELTPAPEED